MNPRDARELIFTHTLGTSDTVRWRSTDDVLDALKAAANGGPVVLRWDTTPCPDCYGDGEVILGDEADVLVPCKPCGGSGVVTAVTLHGLAVADVRRHLARPRGRAVDRRGHG